jgi:DNA-binding GntR family transcriptional regulator
MSQPERIVAEAMLASDVAPATVREGQGVALVHNRLRMAILRGELEPGSSVSQIRLAQDYAVGRTPLREALRMLQREGLVISAPNHRVRIAGLTADDFAEILIARLALEAVAVRITVPTLGSADIATLEGGMAQMEHFQRSEDAVGLSGPHRSFHHTLVAAAGKRVTASIGELTDYAERYRRRFGASANWDDRRAEHRAILDAAASGDAELAARRLVEHYVRTAPIVFDALDRDYDLTRLRIAVGAVAPGAETDLAHR